MFGNDDDVVAKFNNQYGKGEDDLHTGEEPGVRESIDHKTLRATGISTAQHTRRLIQGDKFLEDKTKTKDMPPVSSKNPESKHQPMIKVSSQKNNSRQGLSTAGPKISFQSSLSPDFLNLFAH